MEYNKVSTNIFVVFLQKDLCYRDKQYTTKELLRYAVNKHTIPLVRFPKSGLKREDINGKALLENVHLITSFLSLFQLSLNQLSI